MDRRQALGWRGEELACRELRRNGYTIVHRRFRTRCGEIDIVARERNVLVFVEVKARSGGSFGTPLESVTWQKRKRLSQMAAAYLVMNQLHDVACRFDVVSIVEGRERCAIELVRGAFDMAASL